MAILWLSLIILFNKELRKLYFHKSMQINMKMQLNQRNQSDEFGDTTH